MQGRLQDDNVVATGGLAHRLPQRDGPGHHRQRQRVRRRSPRAFIPRDHIKSVLDAADVVIWTTESPDDQAALLANPEVAARSDRAASHLHLQGFGRRDRVRFTAELPDGRRSTGPADRQDPRLIKVIERLLRHLWQCSNSGRSCRARCCGDRFYERDGSAVLAGRHAATATALLMQFDSTAGYWRGRPLREAALPGVLDIVPAPAPR